MDYRNTPAANGPLVVAFNGRVFGVERDTGEIRWEHALAKRLGQPNRIAITHDRVYAASTNEVCCLDYQTGEEHWRVERLRKGIHALVVHGDRIFIASTGEVECLSLAGDYLWANDFKGKGYGPLAMGVPGDVMQADANS
jgi:outer membrane protein assembly factor BamB